MQGFNIRCWSAQGLEFFAISDINATLTSSTTY
jgi:hypothetical protein